MKHSTKAFLGILLLGVTLGIGTDVLLRQPVFGLNIAILVWTWTLLCLGIASRYGRLSRHAFMYGALALVSSSLIYVRSAEIVQFWLLAVAGVNLWLLAACVSILDYRQLDLAQRASASFRHLVRATQQGLKEGSEYLAAKTHLQIKYPSRGILIAAALAAVFLMLFTAADRVVAGWLSDVSQWLGALFEAVNDDVVARVITSAFWILVTWAILAALLRRANAAPRAGVKIKEHLTTKDARIILITLVTMFTIFVAVQLRYLFGSATLPDGLTYASYAHQGYGQLLFATFLAAAVIKYVLSAIKADKTTTMLALGLIFLNAIVVLAAWMRLSLYEMTYGWTMLRFIARLGLICIGLGMGTLVAWVLGTLSSKQLYASGWYIIAVVLMVAAVLNPEGVIAKHNITERPSRTVVLDTTHLRNLSPDSWPAICESAPKLKNKYAHEYQALLEEKQSKQLPVNHGLSQHFTQTNHFRSEYARCLQ